MSDSPAKAVFLSYASQDAEAARGIRDALRAAGIEVWFDQSELVGGDAWDRKIRQQIKECALFVPVISANTQARAEGYFRLEWRLADQRTHLMGRAKAFLLPVCIDDTDEASADVPDSFAAVQWTRFSRGELPAGFAARVRAMLEPSAVSAATLASTTTKPPAPSAEKSVAVLAFANLSRDPENEYFSDGISEELLNVLAKIPGLRVTARTSSFFFKGKNVPAPEIGRQLGVAHLVEGSVRKSGSRVRITAQLIEAARGFHVWSETYDRELQDIFALQDEVARDIAKNFQITLGAGVERRPVNTEVHRLVLQGRHAWNQFTEEGFVQAEAAFERALKLEPGCATASAGFALVSCRRAILRGLASRYQASALAETEHRARHALQSDPNLAEPYAVLGAVALMRGQFAESGRAFRQALLINPNSDLSLVYHARLLQRQGRPDLARVEIETAQRLSPLTFSFVGHLGLALLSSRRNTEVVDVVNHAEAMGAGSPWARAVGSVALARLGRRVEAVAMARSALHTGPKPESTRGHAALTDGVAAWALAAAGEREASTAVVLQLRQEPAPWHYAAGFALAALGERNVGFALLADLPQFMADHMLIFADQNESVQADPQFHELLRKLDAREAFETHQKTIRSLEAVS